MPYVMYMYTYYVNRDMQTIIETVSKILSGAGLLFAFFFKKGLRPLFGTVEWPRTQEKQERHRHMSRKSGWKDLSLFPQSSHQTVQSSCRSLQILKVLTLSHQLQDTDVTGLSVNTFNICSQSQSSQNIFWAHPWHPHFFHRSVSSSAWHGCITICVCVCVGRRLALE